MDSLEDVTDLIKRAIVEDPPLAQKDGGIIKEGYNEDVDKFRRSRTDGKKWLSELEARERERTGIKSLKIKYNRVFGYSLEVTNTFKDLVPEDYIRKQTLTNAERYITQELKDLEAQEKECGNDRTCRCRITICLTNTVVFFSSIVKAPDRLCTLGNSNADRKKNHIYF